MRRAPAIEALQAYLAKKMIAPILKLLTRKGHFIERRA